MLLFVLQEKKKTNLKSHKCVDQPRAQCMLIRDQRSLASPHCPSPACPAGWGAQMDLR